MRRRRNVFVFMGLFMAVMTVGLCVAAGRSKTVERPPSDFVRMVTAFELQRVHWKAFTPQAESRTIGIKDLVDQIGAGCMPEKLDFSWNVKFIASSPGIQAFKGVNASSQEEAAIAEVADTGNEVWRETSSGTWHLVSPLRTESVCLMCHSSDREVAATPKVDQPIGYVSLELSRNPQDR